MSQVPPGEFGLHPTGPATGAQVAARANATFAALQSKNSGATEPANLVDGMEWLDTSDGSLWALKVRRGNAWTTLWTIDPTTGDFKIAGLSQGDNRVINGDFRVNQRGYVSNTALASGAFGLDRWKATTANSRMVFTANPAGAQVTITGSFAQVIEQADLPAGTYTLSWTGTAQGRCYKSGSSAIAYAAGPRTVTIDGAGNYIVEFSAGTLGEVRLELGNVAQPFQQRPYGIELALCQRYYEKGGFNALIQATAAGQYATDFPRYKVAKRTSSPAVSLSYNFAANNGVVTTLLVADDGFAISTPSIAAGLCQINGTWTSNAEL